jgi:hypothetical protein
MDRDYWHQACTAKTGRTLSQLQQANFGGGGFAVSSQRIALLRL